MSIVQSITIREIPRALAKSLIEKHHYSKILPPTISKYCLGVFVPSEDTSSFFSFDEELVGCIVYGKPPGIHVSKSIAPDLGESSVLELVRLWIDDSIGRNAESRVIALSFDWLRTHAPEVKALISYADPSVGHKGTIYQATNWLYQGCGEMTVKQYFVKTDVNEPWIHSRTCKELYDTTALTPQVLYEKLGHGYWRRLQSQKHRYIYILAKGRERKKLINSLKYSIYPYPKMEEESSIDIERVDFKDEKLHISLETVENIEKYSLDKFRH